MSVLPLKHLLPSGDLPRDGGPSISPLIMQFKKQELLLRRPLALTDLQIQVVVESGVKKVSPLSALFATSSLDTELSDHDFRNMAPFLDLSV